MVLLADYTIFQKAFSFLNDNNKRVIINILYNANNKICFSKGLLDCLEKEISELDFFHAFVRELSDSNRIINENSDSNKSFHEQLIEVFSRSKIDCLLPITVDYKKELDPIDDNLVTINHSSRVNKDWIATEIISKGFCSVCYNDFLDDKEIEIFFRNIFALPKFIKKVSIFNREHEGFSYLRPLKGRHIVLYTLLFRVNRYMYNEKISDLKKELGGKIKLAYTGNKRLIHERKVIFGDLIVTIDNSLSNLTVKEPTWEINVCLDPIKAKTWLEKGDKFNTFS